MNSTIKSMYIPYASINDLRIISAKLATICNAHVATDRGMLYVSKLFRTRSPFITAAPANDVALLAIFMTFFANVIVSSLIPSAEYSSDAPFSAIC